MFDTIPDDPPHNQSLDPLINQVLESRYRIDAEVGRGGMGVVYRGTDLTLSRPVAIKTILHRESNEEALRRFINEARTLAQIETPRLVPVYAVGQDEGYHYIVMKFLEGEDLSEIMKREGVLPVERVIDITTQVCEALTALHNRGIVHRDIKPANLMIAPDGKVTVMDLGIAKGMGETPTSSAMGTPKYMPPEAIDNKPLDARADLYSLAIITYQALAGKVPFDGATPMAILYLQAHQEPPSIRELAPHVPRAVELFINKALKKNPNERYQSASEMARALSGQGEPSASLAKGGLVAYLIASMTLGVLAWVLMRGPSLPPQVTPSAERSAATSPEVRRAVTGAAPQGGKAIMIPTPPPTPISPPLPRLNEPNKITSPLDAVEPETKQAQKIEKKRRVKPRERRVRVRVNSEPRGAEIYYKGKRLGKTPETIEKPEDESWTIVFKLKGFKTRTRSVQDKDVRVKLKSVFGGF